MIHPRNEKVPCKNLIIINFLANLSILHFVWTRLYNSRMPGQCYRTVIWETPFHGPAPPLSLIKSIPLGETHKPIDIRWDINKVKISCWYYTRRPILCLRRVRTSLTIDLVKPHAISLERAVIGQLGQDSGDPRACSSMGVEKAALDW